MSTKEGIVLKGMEKPIEEYTSLLLLNVGAVQIKREGETPFTYTSGNKGPIYIDCRILISYTTQMSIIAGFLKNFIDLHAKDIEFVAGGATAGMPFAQKVSELAGLPYFYIRKEDRKHGIKDRVVGDLSILREEPQGILIEDLITNGQSKDRFVQSLRYKGMECRHCFVIFDREQGGRECLKKINVKLYSLTTMYYTLKLALNRHYIDLHTFHTVSQYLENPKKWAKNRGYDFHE